MSIHNINEELAAVAKTAPGIQLGDSATDLVGFYGTTGVVQPTALTAASAQAITAPLTVLTHTAPSTPDFAIQALSDSSPFGFVTADEGNTVLQVVVRSALQLTEIELQLAAEIVRVGELEAKLTALGLIAA